MDVRESRTIVGHEVVDFPGLPGEEAGMTTGGVSADAYLALKSAFKEMKDRYLESEQRCGELLKRSKKKEAKDSLMLAQVYHERDEMLERLKKSYAAFQEKYTENEELQKRIEETKAEIERLKKESKVKEEENEALVSEITKISEHLHERENEVEQLRILQAQVKETASCSEKGPPKVVHNCSQTLTSSEEMVTLDKLLNKMENYGLQIVERCETLFVWVVDKGKLKTCVAECADKNAASVFEKFLLEEKSTNLETGQLYTLEEFNLVSKKHMEAEGKVILLKQKIEDQAHEICRLRKVCSDVMHQHSKCNKGKQKTLEWEAKDLQRNLKEGALSNDQSDDGVAQVVKTETEKPVAADKRYEELLINVVAIIQQITELNAELDTQGKCVQQLIRMTETSTHMLSTRERYNTERQFLTEGPPDHSRMLSIPVQETEISFPARTIGAPDKEIPCSSGGASDEEAGEISVAEELNPPVEVEPPLFGLLSRATPVEGAFSPQLPGREFPRRHEERSEGLPSGSLLEVLRPSLVYAERAESTGESDIEVIDENDQQFGATSTVRGKLCPVCESYFPSVHAQDEFERHVRSHFDDE